MHLLKVLVAVACATGTTAQLHNLAQKHGRFFGTSVGKNLGRLQRYDALVRNKADYGAFAPKDQMQWKNLSPVDGKYSFGKSGADAFVNATVDGCERLRCGIILDPANIPEWVLKKDWASKTAIREYLRTYVKRAVRRYRGKCESWDLAGNVLDSAGKLRSNWLNKKFGKEWMEIAYKAAHEADPKAKLYYVDDNIYWPNAKANAVRDLIVGLNKTGAYIHGVGIQFHIDSESPRTYSEFRNVMRFFRDSGLEIVVTDLEIRIKNPKTSKKLHHQNLIAKNIVKACLNVASCRGIMLREIYDGFTDTATRFPRNDHAGILFEDFKKHPMYYGLVEVLHTGSPRCPKKLKREEAAIADDDMFDLDCIDLPTLQRLQVESAFVEGDAEEEEDDE